MGKHIFAEKRSKTSIPEIIIQPKISIQINKIFLLKIKKETKNYEFI